MPRSTVSSSSRGRSSFPAQTSQPRASQSVRREAGSMTDRERAYYARTAGRQKKASSVKPSLPTQQRVQAQHTSCETVAPRSRATQRSPDTNTGDRERRSSQEPIPAEGSLDVFLLGLLGVSSGMRDQDVLQLMVSASANTGLEDALVESLLLGRGNMARTHSQQAPGSAPLDRRIGTAQNRYGSQEPIPIEASLEPMLIALLGGGCVESRREPERVAQGARAPRLSSQEPIPLEEPIDALLESVLARDAEARHSSGRPGPFQPPSRGNSMLASQQHQVRQQVASDTSAVNSTNAASVHRRRGGQHDVSLRRLGDWRRSSRVTYAEQDRPLAEPRPQSVDNHFEQPTHVSSAAGCCVRFDGKGEKECQICLEEYVFNADLLVLPCLHRFHGRCINQWISLHSTCPICRRTT